MIRIQLPQAEVDRLTQRLRSTDDRKFRDRLQIVLLAQCGRPHQDIAADLCINRRSVQRWLNANCERGADGLLPRKPKGAPAKVPAEMAEEVRRWVIDGPAKQGLDRANWTYEELADHLRQAKGIKTSRSAMHRFCSKIDIRPYRPTYRYLRGDPVKQAKAREDNPALIEAGGRTGDGRMNEEEWLEYVELEPMLTFLRDRVSERKRRLFAAACCRRLWRRLKDGRSRQAVNVAERFADGLATGAERKAALEGASAAYFAIKGLTMRPRGRLVLSPMPMMSLTFLTLASPSRRPARLPVPPGTTNAKRPLN